MAREAVFDSRRTLVSWLTSPSCCRVTWSQAFASSSFPSLTWIFSGSPNGIRTRASTLRGPPDVFSRYQPLPNSPESLGFRSARSGLMLPRAAWLGVTRV